MLERIPVNFIEKVMEIPIRASWFFFKSGVLLMIAVKATPIMMANDVNSTKTVIEWKRHLWLNL